MLETIVFMGTVGGIMIGFVSGVFHALSHLGLLDEEEDEEPSCMFV